MVKISAARQTVDVKLSSGANVTAYTSLTVADQRELEKEFGDLKAIAADRQTDFALSAVEKLIKTWDFTDDDEKPVQVNEESLSKIPQVDLKLIFETAQKKAQEGMQQS